MLIKQFFEKSVHEGSNGMESSTTPVRFGILGTANIALKFMAAAKKIPSIVQVVAVASRSLEKAQEWAKEQGIERAYGSYEALLDDADVQAVYIPLPTNLHAKYTILAASKGKHVLCEKPLATTMEETEAMISACEKNGVQFMDGVMWTHHTRTTEMKNRFPLLGDIRKVNGCFTIDRLPTDNIRFNKDTEPLGALGDLGWYNVRSILFGFGEESLPEKVWATSTFSEGGATNGVPVDTHAVLWFSNDRVATFDCSFNSTGWRQWMEIVGTKGRIVCDDFVLPWFGTPFNFPQIKEYDEKATFTLHRNVSDLKEGESLSETVVVEPCIQEVELIKTFSRIVREGKLESRWHTLSRNNMKIVLALYEAARTGTVVSL